MAYQQFNRLLWLFLTSSLLLGFADEGPRIEGRLVDESGAPVADASVFLYGKQDASVVWYAFDVKRNGTFVSPALPDRRPYTFMAWGEGYLPHVEKGIVPGEKTLHVVLKRGATVSGRVLSSRSGGPIGAFEIFWLNHLKEHFPSYEPGWRTRATHVPWEPIYFQDAKGRFTIRGVPEGGNLLAVEARGHYRGTAPVTVDSSGDAVKGLCVKLDALSGLGGTVHIRGRLGTRAGVVVVPWQVGETVMTTLYNEEGIRLGDVHHPGLLAAVTDAMGRFSLALPPGTYYLHLGRGYGFMDDVQRYGPYEVESGGLKMKPLSLEYVEHTGVVEARVVDEQGAPIRELYVSVGALKHGDDGFHSLRAKTDEQGRVRLEKVRPGKRVVFAVLDRGSGTQELSRVVDVTARGVTKVELSPESTGSLGRVSGRVLCDGTPLPGVKVELSKAGNVNYRDTKRTRRDGSFVFERVSPGRFILQSCESDRIPLEISPAGGEIEREIVVGPFELKGRIVFPGRAEGKRDYQATFLLFAQESPVPTRLIFRQAGEELSFHFDYLFKGPYDLHVLVNPLRPSPNAPVEHGYHFTGFMQMIDPCKRGTKAAIAIPLKRAGGLEVRMPFARDTYDFAIFLCLENGAEIKMVFARPRMIYGAELVSCIYPTLIPGRYRVEFTESESRHVEVKSGRITKLEFRLK